MYMSSPGSAKVSSGGGVAFSLPFDARVFLAMSGFSFGLQGRGFGFKIVEGCTTFCQSDNRGCGGLYYLYGSGAARRGGGAGGCCR